MLISLNKIAHLAQSERFSFKLSFEKGVNYENY